MAELERGHALSVTDIDKAVGNIIYKLDEVINQLKIINAYNALGHDAELSIEAAKDD